MRFEVKLPRLGETVDEVIIVEWEAAIDAEVAAGDVLFRVETDKAEVEVPSPVSGRLVEQSVRAGEDVMTGTVVAIIESA
ncbi:MAG: biotin/lipoyl-containing protein [Nocardioidaceae bacterium]